MCESMGLNGLWCTRPVFNIVKRGEEGMGSRLRGNDGLESLRV